MKKTNIEENLGIAAKMDYKPRDDNVERLFKNRQDERVELIEESISDIKKMISEREELHKALLYNLKEMDIFINNSMPKVDSATSRDSVALEKDLIKELLKKKIELEELKIQEKLNVWRDVALLKKELREHMKEFRDTQSKTSMIDNILEM